MCATPDISVANRTLKIRSALHFDSKESPRDELNDVRREYVAVAAKLRWGEIFLEKQVLVLLFVTGADLRSTLARVQPSCIR